MKVVTQPGKKNAEISRTFNALKKMKEKKFEKSKNVKRNKSLEKLLDFKRKQDDNKGQQLSSNEKTIIYNSSGLFRQNQRNKSMEDFWDFTRPLSFPIITRNVSPNFKSIKESTSVKDSILEALFEAWKSNKIRHERRKLATQPVNAPSEQPSSRPISMKISEPLPKIKDSPSQPFTFKVFSDNEQIKARNDVPAHQQSFSSKLLSSISNNTEISENCFRNSAKNQSPKVQQNSQMQQLVFPAPSSNLHLNDSNMTTASNTLPLLVHASSSQQSATLSLSNKKHLIGFKNDTMNKVTPIFEQVSSKQSSTYAPLSSNVHPIDSGKISMYNQSLASEYASSSQQSTTISFSNRVPLNAYNATNMKETTSEFKNSSPQESTSEQSCVPPEDGGNENKQIPKDINMEFVINKNNIQDNDNSSFGIKREAKEKVEDQRVVRDCFIKNEDLQGSHAAALDDSKCLERNEETMDCDFASLKFELHTLKSNILEENRKEKIESAKDNVTPFMNLPSKKCAGESNLKNLTDITNSSTSACQQDKCNAESSNSKNKYNFRFSTPIYNYVNFTPSGSETTSQLDRTVPFEESMDNCLTSNSSSYDKYNFLKTYLTSCHLQEPFGSQNIMKDFINVRNFSHTSGESDTSEKSSMSSNEERPSSDTNDSNISMNSGPESGSSQESSSNSCLVTSSSTDDEHEINGQHTISFNFADDNNICEEYPKIAVNEDLKQTEEKSSTEPVLSPTPSTSFSNDKLRDVGNERSSKRMTPQKKPDYKPFENGSLYWLKQGRSLSKNKCEQRETIPTNVSRSKSHNCGSLRIQVLMSSKPQEKCRSATRGEPCSDNSSKSRINHLQGNSSINQRDKNNSKKIHATPKTEAAKLSEKMQLDQLSTNQILAQIGLSVLTHETSSPRNTYLETYKKLLTMCGNQK
ncbi:hypothetical protein HNY73_018322 [Argiope bruennichi]|uniref:Uncharacterized protein n=1 Tax=Argiope bruennichi TaxID=94029 RepID=A0A8T0EHF8_ARGBR|nr:hypothetical protein HNY73_018322 [Argiope bruennichi]